MRRTLAAAGTALLVSLAVTGCGGDGGVKKSGPGPGAARSTVVSPSDVSSPSGVVTGLPSDLPTDVPTELPTDLPTGLPTDLPSDLPTALPTDVPSPAPGGALDACAIVTAALISADFGGASTGQMLSQPSSFGDPGATDCYYVGGDATIVIQATSRADQDMPESQYSYAGLPGAEAISGATRGWAYVFPGQAGSDSITSGLILVKGQSGFSFSITIAGHPYTNANLQRLAKDVLPSM